jgi:hypothetical protein
VKTIESVLVDFGPERRSTATGSESHELSHLICQLHGLAQEAIRIVERAVGRGDNRTAIAAIPEICRIVELIAKLDGKLEEKSTTNIMHVNIDPKTAQKIAEIYVKRHNSLLQEEL